MIFNGARHRAERPGDKQMLAEIERVTTAFLQAYLCDNKEQRNWLDKKAAAYVSSDAKMEQK